MAFFFRDKIEKEIKEAIGVLKIEGQTSFRKVQLCIEHILKVKIGLGTIVKEIFKASKRAKEIIENVQSLVVIKISNIDETWVKVKAIEGGSEWRYGLANVVPESSFLYSFDMLYSREKEEIETAVVKYKSKGFNPIIFISDILQAYIGIIKERFVKTKQQLCKIHVIKNIGRIIKEMPQEEKWIIEYAKKIKERFSKLYKKRDIVAIGLEVKQIKKELKLFQGKNKEIMEPLLEFIERHEGKFFFYKIWNKEYNSKKMKIPETSNMVENTFSIYKPMYRRGKYYESEETGQKHFDLYWIWHNFRVFSRGRRRGKSPIEMEGIKTEVRNWAELIWGKYRDVPISQVIRPGKGLKKEMMELCLTS